MLFNEGLNCWDYIALHYIALHYIALHDLTVFILIVLISICILSDWEEYNLDTIRGKEYFDTKVFFTSEEVFIKF